MRRSDRSLDEPYDYERRWHTAQLDDMRKYGPTARHVRRIVKRMVRDLEVESVLDVGCGQGSLLAELSEEHAGIRLHGVDVSKTALELARSKVAGQFSVMDIEQGALDKQFDLVLCIEVLEHIDDDLSALRNLAFMSAKYLLVVTVQGRMRRFEPQEVGHVRNYARGELVTKMQDAGLHITRVVEWGFPFYSPLYRNLLEITGAKGTSGEFGIVRKLASQALYALFMLNSSRRGDKVFVLARSKS